MKRSGKMAKRKIHIYGITPIMSIALIAMFLTLGFCPLRNTLFAVISHSVNSVPKTTGSRLLNAQDNCKTTALNFKAIVQRSNSWHPSLSPGVAQIYLFIAAVLFFKCRDQSYNYINCRPQKIPLYTLNCTFRI